ncbi:hypothetical protein CWATWH8502_755 [Crocosphaera watsonii WH 8502]|uniref:Uncharacterized protein n=3 Tax=Crocosphaera watsonii TaxID=263511 RepID=T2JUG1_CROWT|nr:hypothetical protein CWATWH8502_755 [Crocosphaera watsonii WH 8502]CCQ56478.1 hypothetical protein CWATWH0005_5756 [Crocosphaera watsonii WH 0005]CCQ68830.1 hypothetical protein CWATWH0402_5987 [Crocosphaera watsonii WH 0402]
MGLPDSRSDISAHRAISAKVEQKEIAFSAQRSESLPRSLIVATFLILGWLPLIYSSIVLKYG